MRRRLFGQSHESANSIINSSSRSKGSSLASPTARETPEDKDKDSITELKEKETNNNKDLDIRHPRSKKSSHAKHSDRLSIFGATFSGSLGKGRKPPPRFV